MTEKESAEGEKEVRNESPPKNETIESIDWEKTAKYKAAELENYIKRHKDAVSNAFTDGRAHVISCILPILDSLNEAVKTARKEKEWGNTELFRQGLEVLQRKFESILETLGVEEISVKKGDPYDPYIHNCASAREHTNNTVVEVWQKGFKFAGKVIRPVTVKI
jgi:molecular chaperone GrpE